MALRRIVPTVWSLRFQAAAQQAAPAFAPALLRGFASVDTSCKYASSHEWAKADGETATVGISHHAQEELGDVVYVELPEVGATVTKGETFGVVESVKAASDVYSPISGEVVEINGALADEPAKINGEPHAGGWMIKVKMSNKGELDSLMSPADYEKHIQ